MFKTTKVVCELCKPFEGSHYTLYIYITYIFNTLMKDLDIIPLYDTGTKTDFQ